MKIYREEKKVLVECVPKELFPFLREKGHVVSLVGAGGKTALLYALAEAGAEGGFRTLVTTTTHIFEPQNGCYAETDEEVYRLWGEGSPAVVGLRTAEGKLKALPKEVLEGVWKDADLVLIEADGAKRMPCKAPREREPVLVEECDTVLGVFGLKSIGRPLEEVCFGIEEAKGILGISEGGHRVMPEDGVKLLVSKDGGRKYVGNRTYYAMVHQCDITHGMEYGLEMLERLQEEGVTGLLSCEG